MGKIVLCADTESLRHPQLLGLDDVNLEAVPWLECFARAEEARSFLRASHEVDEVWVVSSDDVAAINAAAAIKQDDALRDVYLVLFETSGSVLSRARAARVTDVLTKQGLVQRFASEKRRRARALDHGKRAVEESSREDSSAEEASSKGSACASAFVLTVASGSGGAGKSTVSALAAHLASKRGVRTLLIDCDLQFGDIHHLTQVRKAATLDELMTSGGVTSAVSAVGVAGLLEAGEDALVLVGAPKRLEQADMVASVLPGLIDELSALFDLVVVNTGASWAEHHAALIERSTRTVLLVDQRISSVRACQHAVDLCARCGIATGSFVYVLNRCAKGAPLTSIDVSCALQGARVLELADGGSVVEELAGSGHVDELMASGNVLCESVERLLDEVLPESASLASRPGAARAGKRTRQKGMLLRRTARRARRKEDSGLLENRAGGEVASATGGAIGADRGMKKVRTEGAASARLAEGEQVRA